MEDLSKVISSFKYQKTLHPKIWTEKGKMNPNVRKNLLEIAYQFIDSLDTEVVIDDIIVVGSIANFNWSKYSDIDVHILVDFKQYQKDLKNMYVEYFDLKKIVFNQKRNIKMFGFDVEVFIEDVDMKGVSGGIYSILEDKWIEKPKRIEPKIDFNLVKTKAKQWMKIIDTYVNNLEDEDIETIEKTFSDYKRKLKKFRLSGLKKGGEMSLENLVFKVLRRNGYIEKLYSSPLKQIDNKLSIK
jgi:predicted nucleotidyltransferase